MRGVNAEYQEVLTIRNTADHKSAVLDFRTLGKGLVKITNGLNQDCTVTLQGTTFDDPTGLIPADIDVVTVPAGETRYLSTDAPFSYLLCNAKCGTGPASGDLVLTWEFKKGSD